MRIATFNLENLFTRPTAMNMSNDAAGRKAIEDHAIANAIVAKAVYSPADKAKLVSLSKKYGWHNLNPPANALVQLQKIRGALFRKPKNGPLEVVADGRGDWTGWFELRRDDVIWKATYNTARVIAEVNADVLVAVEVEDRPTLERFNAQVLDAEFECRYPFAMVIDGNDARGIDVGILSRFPIERIQSHVYDMGASGTAIFSRDCPEFDVILPNGERLIVLPNHFKSKRNGNDQQSMDRRRAQAEAAHAIALAALTRSAHVLIGGDLNDTPSIGGPLSNLFLDGFHDVSDRPEYPADRPGTYKTGLAGNKLDYLISSPQLWAAVTNCGIERRGSWHPNTWAPFDTVTKASEEASDHHCVWMDVQLA